MVVCSRRRLVRAARSEALPKRILEERRFIRAATEDRPKPRHSGGRAGESPAPARSQESRPLLGVTVLVVDDDDASRDYFAMALKAAGALVVTAATAIDALRLLQDRRPDVVLSDIAMPNQDGYWLVNQVRGLADPATRVVPVIATTAYGYTHSRQRALEAGFIDHLPKPVEPDILTAAITRAARRAT